jgi:hypothetical protein
MAKPNRSRNAAAKPAARKPAPKPAAKKAAPKPPAAKKAAPKAKAKAKPAKSSKSTILPLAKGLDAEQRKLAIAQRKATERRIQELQAAKADVNVQREARKIFEQQQRQEERRLARALAEQWRIEASEAGVSDSSVGSDALHASISDAARKAVASRDQHKAQLQQKKAQLDAEKAAQNNFQQAQQAKKQGGKK